ncbi:MAG: LPXTG cell wall anchor domain-containing protein, partial [Erysipelotrichaceae bacterium]
ADNAIKTISATNETTNKIILDAVTKSVSSVDGVSATWKAGSPTITLATKDTAGSIKGTIVLTSGSKTMEVTVDKLIEKLTTATPDKPTITVGSGSNHQVNTSNDMTFTCSGKLEDLNGVYVDGKLVAESNYTLKSGSTILTLKSSYLDTLSVGKHILKFQYKDNVAAETNFTITTKTSTPNTGDTSNTMLCFGLMILSGCLAGYSLKKKKALRS